MKHTAGPWVVATTDDACDMYDVDGIGIYAAKDLAAVDAGECGSALAYVSDNWGEFKANAALMASAPELVEVVRDIVADCKGHINPGLYDLAVAALAKAEGK